MSHQNIPSIEEDEEDPGWGLGWAYWVIWIMANVVGWSLSSLMRNAIIEASGSSMTQVITGVAIGLCLGLAHWFALLGQPVKTGIWWVLATVAGWGFGWAIGWQAGWMFFGTQGFGTVFGTIGLVAGALASFGQWSILRGQVQQAGWWIPVNAMGWGVGVAVTYMYFRFSYGWFVTSGLAGAITGAVLIWLLRHPVPDYRTPQ